MVTPLSWYPRPPVDTGLGLHDSHLTGDNPSDIRQHAKNLRAAGITWYKILAGGVNKVERVRIYAQEGIMSVVRLYDERPHPNFIPNSDEVRQYKEAAAAVGGVYIEAGNEPNLLEEVEGGRINPEADAAQWIRASDAIKNGGGVPVVYACTPGGHMNHRIYTNRFLAEVRRLGRMDSFDKAALGIHPRPLNNPPDAARDTGNPPNTTTWNEWTWYREAYFNALGWHIPMIATEHGYSGGGQENSDHPPMNQSTWAEWNKELFNRFNPAHPKALPADFLAACYWLEINHGVWIHDAPFANNGREWIDNAPRQDDRAWGKALWTIQPNWNRRNMTTTPQPPQPTTLTDRFIQLARAEFGDKFEDLRGTLLKHPTRRFDPIDSRLMRYLCFHHSATPINTTWKRVAEAHVNERDFAGIGYALGVRLGKLALLGDLDTIRAHVLNRNDEALGACIMGNYDTGVLSAENLDIMKRLVKVLDVLYERDKEITSHGAMLPNYTACPGSDIKRVLPTLRQAPTPPPPPPDFKKIVWQGEDAMRSEEREGRMQNAEWIRLNWVEPAIRERDKVTA